LFRVNILSVINHKNMPKKYRRNCDNCKKEYFGFGKYFCSHKCQANYSRFNKTEKQIEALKKFGIKTRFKKGMKSWNKGIPMTEEQKEIVRKANIGNKHHLGHKHSEETKKKISEKNTGRTGYWTGKKRPPFSMETRLKMSRPVKEETKKKISEALKGENHWNWKKDRNELKTCDNRIFDTKYKEWVRIVKIRDNFKCKINNKDCFGRLEAHHICRWSDFPELRYEINNGITLCKFHHPRKVREEIKLEPIFKELIKEKINIK
jgi:hypothetical protein